MNWIELNWIELNWMYVKGECMCVRELEWIMSCTAPHSSASYQRTLFSTESSSCSESDPDETANRANFFFGVSDVFFFHRLLCFLSKLVTEPHISPHSALGIHLRSLNFGSNAVAIFDMQCWHFPCVWVRGWPECRPHRQGHLLSSPSPERDGKKQADLQSLKHTFSPPRSSVTYLQQKKIY